ncbi:MAG: type II toxin-antitoxin system PemK/MazF family toxin [Blautia sp.]|nr:type II toxin-antitoxin system PemK/MazF family toxin [Blautia sp.]
MDIEKLYDDLIHILRQFTNSINRNNINEKEEVISTLSDMINRIAFIMKNDSESKVIDKRLVKELRKLSKEMFVKTTNKAIYLEKMQKNIDYLSWINKARNINLNARKYTVAQKEIFYANLGDNIGSEQNGRRPVIILQNNIGNVNGNTTIIAPVTTHQKKIKWDDVKRKYYIEIVKDGVTKNKYLDFYEVPLRLEANTNGLYGFVNVMHIRGIDRKRIDSRCLGIATDGCFNNIIKAINKNLNL